MASAFGNNSKAALRQQLQERQKIARASSHDDDDEMMDDDILPDLDLGINLGGRNQKSLENNRLLQNTDASLGYDSSVSCCERFWRFCTACFDPWKIVPAMLVSYALWFSTAVLTVCTLASVTTTTDDDPSADGTETTIRFGLWGYSDPTHARFNHTFATTPIDTVRTCQYDFDQTTNSELVEIVLDDTFRTARAFGVLAVCFGALTMGTLWMAVLIVKDHRSTTNWRRWVGGLLWLCCFLEGMTLLVFDSNVCGDVFQHEEEERLSNGGKGAAGGGVQYRDCRLDRGAMLVLAACGMWFLAGVLLLKWPRAKDEYHQNTLHETYRRYPRERLAEDEAYAGLSPVAEAADERPGLLRGMWDSFRDEESVEMAPYYDHRHPQDPQQQNQRRLPERTTNSSGSGSGEEEHSSENRTHLSLRSMQLSSVRSSIRDLSSTQSSIRSIFSGFGDEIASDSNPATNGQRPSGAPTSSRAATLKAKLQQQQQDKQEELLRKQQLEKDQQYKSKHEAELEKQLAQWMPPESKIARPGVPHRVRQQLSHYSSPTTTPKNIRSPPQEQQQKQQQQEEEDLSSSSRSSKRQFSLRSLRQSSMMSLQEEEVAVPLDDYSGQRPRPPSTTSSARRPPIRNLQTLRRQPSEERVITREVAALAAVDSDDDCDPDVDTANFASTRQQQPMKAEDTLQDILSAFDD